MKIKHDYFNYLPWKYHKSLKYTPTIFYSLTDKKKMAKRSNNTTEDKSTKRPKHWSLGLLESMKDPNLVIKRTDRLVVIKDKYPKAKFHYLILPEENISSIYKLDRSHINLLEEFGQLYQKLVEDHKDCKLLAGFHAIPSMQRLHMHVISNDMISPCLKTKVHWNSFTTNFFILYEDIVKELKHNGHIQKISPEDHKKLMSAALKCNQCNYQPKNMPQLKEHLLTHNKLS